MNRQSPLAANPSKPGHWIPGQRLIYMSTGVAERITSEELKQLTRGDALAIQMPLDPKTVDLVNFSKSAHEIWILHGEAIGNPSLESLLKFRSQSIPVTAGERRSVLHAPELGIVRTFAVAPSSVLVRQDVLLPLGEIEPRLEAAWVAMRSFGRRIAAINPNSESCAPSQPLRGLSDSTLEQLRTTSLQSATQDERSVRWMLARLFAVTVVGVVLLQVMATAGWSVPMSDIYAVFFMLVGSSYIWAREYHLNDRQWQYRLIAQSIEVHMLWCRAGLNEPVTAHFQLRHHASLKWIRELLRFSFLTGTSKATPNCSTYGHPNCSRQDAQIMGFGVGAWAGFLS